MPKLISPSPSPLRPSPIPIAVHGRPPATTLASLLVVVSSSHLLPLPLLKSLSPSLTFFLSLEASLFLPLISIRPQTNQMRARSSDNTHWLAIFRASRNTEKKLASRGTTAMGARQIVKIASLSLHHFVCWTN